MNGKVLFDTNILLYLSAHDDPRRARAQALVQGGGLISVQSLNEIVNVSRRKLNLSWTAIEERITEVRFLCATVLPLTREVHERALALSIRYGFRIFDANLIASALLAGCTTLYTEDMQDGQQIESLTTRNPFIAPG